MVRFGDKDVRTLLKNLNRYQKDKQKRIGDIIQAEALEVRNDVVKSIQTPSVSGRSYKVGGVIRVASAPGVAPNSQTGTLARSYKVKSMNKRLTALVYTNSKYAAPLEFGTRNMLPRPHLYKAYNLHRETIKQKIKNELSRK